MSYITLEWVNPFPGLNYTKGRVSKLMYEITKGCLQLKHAFLSEIIGLAIEHLGHVGNIVSLSLNGLDLTDKLPSYIYSAHLLLTIRCDNLS
jgi:hypothetical protein